MKLDLCSVQQEGKRIISFMSQAIGMMADVDLGTENLRWMGDTRFMVGFIREGTISSRAKIFQES
jgi:sphingosine kinase